MPINRRTLLRRQIADAWKKTITQQYCDQLINSEHGLQVYFCMALLESIRQFEVSRRLFVEPRLCASDTSERSYPDVVICNSKNVIGIVELKYVPKDVPDTGKDLRTLQFAAKHGPALVISNQRYLGPSRDSRPYPLAPNAILCWAGVYTGKRIPLELMVNPEIANRFLQLDAITSEATAPMVYVSGEIAI